MGILDVILSSFHQSAPITLNAGLAAGDAVLLIVNDANDPVIGTFAGQGQGSMVNPQFSISYLFDARSGTDGGGNDVALIFVPVPSPTLIGLATLGALAIKRQRKATKSPCVIVRH